MEENNKENFAGDLMGHIKQKIAKENLIALKESIRNAVKESINVGLDAGEIMALLIGGFRGSPKYIPELDEFYCLQVKRAVIKEMEGNKSDEKNKKN